MVNRKKYLCLLLSGVLFVSSCFLTGCGSNKTDVATPEKKDPETLATEKGNLLYEKDDTLSESENFATWTDEMFLDDISDNIIDLHYTMAYPENFGVTDYDVTLGSYDPSDKDDDEQECLDLLATLQSFDREQLTREQQIAYDIMLDDVTYCMEYDDIYYYGEVFSGLTGFHTQLPVLLAEYTFRTKQDVKDYLEVIATVDDTFESYMVYEQEKADEGLFMPDYAIDDVIEGCEGFLEETEDHYLITSFDERIDQMNEISDEDKEAYKEQNKELILHDMMPAYENLIDDMEALRGSGTNELGLYYFDHGQEYYEYLIRSTVGTDKSMDDIADITKEFMEARYDRIIDLVSSDPDLYDDWLEAVYPLTEPEEVMDDLIEKAANDFPTPPDVSYTIKYVPESMEEHLNPAFYLIPPIDDTENNVIYINGKDSGNEDMYPLLAHEGYPGHLYQTVLSSEYDRPLIRNEFSFGGYTEGWATYTEMYSYTYCGLPADIAVLEQCDTMFTLSLSTYIDIEVNYYGWDQDDVQEFLDGYGIGDEETAESILHMVVEEPGEYAKYFVGYLEFLNLRGEAKEALGDDFDIKAFHEFLISMGPCPFYIIDDYMQEWIDEQ